MPIPGPDILRQIADFAASAVLVEHEARKVTHETSLEIDQLMTSQSEATRELAQLYLPRLEDDVERDGWSEMRATLQSIILRKEDACRQISTRLQQTSEQRIATETRWKQLREQVKDLTSKCDELGRRFSEQLAQDAEFQALSKQAAEGQARLEQAQANLLQVEKDAEEKLPSYQQSRLFQYLQHSAFGTEKYTCRGLTRRVDRWVSNLIDFPRAAAGYKFLSSAPQQMRQLIEEQQKAVRSMVSEVEKRQFEAASALGLPQTQAEGTKVRGEQESAAVAMENSRKGEELARRQLADLDSPDCQYYRDALTAFQHLILKTERSLVAARAAQTPELTDDQVVARLKHIDEQVSENKAKLDRCFSAAEDASKRTARINELASKCRRAQFDDPRRVFEDKFDLQPHLDALLAGTVDVDQVYHEMYRHQHLDSPLADQAAAVLEGPMAQILLSTMAQAAGAALGSYAARAGQQHRVRGQKNGWF